MGWPNGDGHCADVQAAVESADQVGARWEEQSHVIAGVESALVQQQISYALGLLVQLRAGQGRGDGALGVETREDDVVRRAYGSPAQYFRDELVLK